MFHFWTKIRQVSPVLIVLLLAHTVYLGVLGLRAGGVFQPMELAVYDRMLGLRASALKPDPRITLVQCTIEDQRRWGWPLTDRILAQLFERILAHHPRVVGLDIYRDLPVPAEKGPEYARLAKIFKEHKNIIAITKITDEHGAHVDPPPALQGAKRTGFNDLIYDSGGIIRRGLLFMDDGEKFFEYFGLKVALHYLAAARIYLHNEHGDTGRLMLGKVPLPLPLAPDYGGYRHIDTRGYQFLFTYPGAPEMFAKLTLTEALSGRFDPALFAGKIVLIGVRSKATPDFFRTPVSKDALAGVAIHAYNISQLLRLASGEAVMPRAWSELREKYWIWSWCLLAALLCLWTCSLRPVALSALGGLLALAGGSYWMFLHDWWVPVITPAAAWFLSIVLLLVYQSRRERAKRAILMNLFSRHVSKELAETIWQSRDQYIDGGKLRPQRMTATVLLTDLQNFSTVSEKMDPQTLMDWLNEYMDHMVRVVEEHQGQVHKFIGDGIFAMFGVPPIRAGADGIAHNAVNAVECALAMRRELEFLHRQWEAHKLPYIRMRAGIATGDLVAGSVGSIERQEYMVLGDTVNIAASLEAFDKKLDAEESCRILVNGPTLRYLNGQFQTECVGMLRVKGKQESVSVHGVRRRTIKNSFAKRKI